MSRVRMKALATGTAGMTTTNVLVILATFTVAAAAASGATSTFVPVGPTTVPPGTDVVFEVTLAVDVLEEFNTADAIIGSNDAADIGFEYSAEWSAAFTNVTPPFFDIGVYDQDVFVGGNNTSPVGVALLLGTVTVNTAGMSEGAYNVRIDNTVDSGFSRLGLDAAHEPLDGAGVFTIQCSPADGDCDGDVDLNDYASFQSCSTGPGGTAAQGCQGYDLDGDQDIDLVDFALFMILFTGSH